jgi:hypothetical protein
VNREVFWVVFWPRLCRRLQVLSPLGDSATFAPLHGYSTVGKHVLGRSTLWDLAKRAGDRGFMEVRDASVGSHAEGTVSEELLNTGRTVE